MISQEDIAEICFDALKGSQETKANLHQTAERGSTERVMKGFFLRQPFNKPYTSLPAKRIFLSEYDVKQILRNTKVLKIPPKAILSPLAQDWLREKGIKIVQD